MMNKLIREKLKMIYITLFARNKVRKKGLNNRFINKSFICKNNNILFLGNDNIIAFGNNSHISNCYFFVKGNNNIITIEDNCNLMGGEFWIEDDDNQIRVGKGTTMQSKCHFAAIEGCSIDIGNDCMISNEVVIRTGDSHSILNLEGLRVNQSLNVNIGMHCWLGHRSTILKGSVIPSNTIIGTNSIVSKIFLEENTVIAGLPARVIKNNVKWIRERI